jgi:AcrR family transcriptional regulator
LIDAAARLLVTYGPAGLTTRRLAAAAGTSTMAVYTYFRGMDDICAAVAKEGFARLGKRLEALKQTHDVVADITMLGGEYVLNAVTNPHLYRFMFQERLVDDPAIGRETFERLVTAVARAINTGRIGNADPRHLAQQLWVSSHGSVSLHLAGLLSFDDVLECLAETGLTIYVAYGDTRKQARRSIDKALRLIAARAS